MATKAEKLPTGDKGWQTWIQNQKPPEGRRWVAMGGGLVICLELGGAKQFQARIRREGDANPRRISIGSFPEVSVADARQRLAEARSAAKEGKDPAVGRRRAREGIEEVTTFAQLADRYIASRAGNAKLRHKTLLIETQALEPVRRALGDRLLSDLEPRDIASVVTREAERLQKSGRTGRSANLALAACKRVFRYGRGSGLFTAPSPAVEISRPAQEHARERILFDGRVLRSMERPDLNELGLFVSALRSPDSSGPDRPTRVALEVSFLLAMRGGECAALEWLHVRLDDQIPTLLIPDGKTASARRLVPLPQQVVALFRELRATAAHNERYVFASRSGAGRRPHLHPESISRAFARTCAALGIEGATRHDCRRTSASGLLELTGDDALVQKIMGQKGASTLRKVYDQSRQLSPMFDALQRWADAVDDAAARAAPLALPPPLVALPAPSTEARS